MMKMWWRIATRVGLVISNTRGRYFGNSSSRSSTIRCMWRPWWIKTICSLRRRALKTRPLTYRLQTLGKAMLATVTPHNSISYTTISTFVFLALMKNPAMLCPIFISAKAPWKSPFTKPLLLLSRVVTLGTRGCMLDSLLAVAWLLEVEKSRIFKIRTKVQSVLKKYLTQFSL